METDYHKRFIRSGLLRVVWAAGCLVLLQGCTAADGPDEMPEPAVRVELDVLPGQSKALGDAAYSVNRLLLLPFKKIDEAGADDAANFAPVYASARQIDVNSFTAYALIHNLDRTSTYRMAVIGYTRTDYNYNPSDPAAITGNFSIGAASTPVTLAGFHVKPASAVSVPEFFTCVCTAYGAGDAAIGQSFSPQNVKTLKGTLQRLVSGVSLKITGIPAYVKSVTLSAEQLVQASAIAPAIPSDTAGRPTVWQTAGDANNKVLATVAPDAGGTLTVEKLLLPTFSTRKTRLLMQVFYGSTSETYVVKVQDVAGVSAGNYLVFRPNRVVRITGSYGNIGLGFLLQAAINLDDNAWDGLQ